MIHSTNVQFFGKKWHAGKGISEILSRIWYDTLLFILAGIVLVSLILLKSQTFSEFSGDYLLITYTIFVTFFQLARIISALYYRQSFDGIVGSLPQSQQNEVYEPKVTFVIPCKNEEGAIETTVTKCLAIEYPKDKNEVIVINDGSTDATGAILDELKERLPDENLTVIHWEKNRGKREGMAAGFRIATGEIIIQLDSDSFIQPDTFRKLIEPFRNLAVGAVCAHADPVNADVNFLTKMQAAYYFIAFRILKAAESTYGAVFCCSGCSSAYRKDAVLPIMEEWLNETFLGSKVTWGDDRSLTSWVIKRGYRTVYADEAKAVTIVPETFKQFMTQQIRWKKSWIINAIFTSKFIIKNDPFVAVVYYYPLIIISILTPFMALRALFYSPLAGGGIANTLFYIMGILLITSVLIIMYRYVARDNRYWPYMFAWSGMNIFLLSFLMFYAVATLQNRGWGTR